MPSDLRELAAARRASWLAGVRAFHASVVSFEQAMACVQESARRQRKRLAGRSVRTVWVPSLVRPTSAAVSPIAATSAPSPPPPILEDAGGVLTARQREVAALIARGFSNQQIADRLVLTKGTVANHVEHILARLEARSRAQIAVWAVRQGLDSAPGGDSDARPEAGSGDRRTAAG